MQRQSHRNVARYSVLAIALMTIVGPLVGCGGSTVDGTLPSLYTGNWTGTWQSGDGQTGGNISIAVVRDGSVSGSITRNVDSANGQMAGFIQSDGRLVSNASFATGGNMTMGGYVQLSNGRLVGNFRYSVTGIEYAGTFDAGPASGGGSSN